MIDFNQRFTKKRLTMVADLLQEISDEIGFKVSSRGWCYIMENRRHINKNQFDKIENVINNCRREGVLPVDFVAEEDSRAFSGIERPNTSSVRSTLIWTLNDVLDGHKYHIPDWWIDEEYYIQVLVEKIDLKTLFRDVCSEYHIPIANSKGWSSILQRAEYARRFKEAEDKGRKCVLLYCGDHDPDGLRISDTIRTNLEQLINIEWDDGEEGYNPSNLIIERIGLNYDFIIQNKYTWIDNLITGNIHKKMDLSQRSHPNHNLPYVQHYLKTVGARKCEANAIVTTPGPAKKLIREAIERYLGDDALERFEAKRQAIQDEYEDIANEAGINDIIQKLIDDNE